MDAMNRYLTGVLSVIAAGVLVIAYTAYSAHTAQTAYTVAPSAPWARPSVGAAQADWRDVPVASSASPLDVTPTGVRWIAVPATASPTANAAEPVRPVPAVQAVRAVEFEAAPRRVVRRSVARDGQRNWKKTAMVIGGTTAASAGIGGIFGGKKGALIGAAIGGGASTLYETTR